VSQAERPETPYVREEFTSEEEAILARHFTNVDLPVFAVVNLPEVVKGALFARYSRSSKSLRRLFLDEFHEGLEGDRASGEAGPGLAHAEKLYDRVFVEYGDDSVAQLGGVHLACEQVSNVLTKMLERGRLASYLEQSTRYIGYDDRPGGWWRYFRDPDVLASAVGRRYVETLDGLFETYASLLRPMREHLARSYPREAGVAETAWRASIKAKTLDSMRGLLPAATTSNLGVYASGQAFEQLLIRLRAEPLAEARNYARLILTELRKVIPSFVRRVDLPDRGGAWSEYLESTRSRSEIVARELMAETVCEPRADVTLTSFDPHAEEHLVAAMLYPFTHLPEGQILERVRAMSAEERMRVMWAYVGERGNRRHRPGRAFEHVWYRFDVLGDYGSFRDLQRHRMLTIEWQGLSPLHGYRMPEVVVEAGFEDEWVHAMASSAALYQDLAGPFPRQAPYAVAMGYRIRYSMQMNAREAMHVLELRTSPAGHASYRRLCQEMHRQISEIAGHRLVAEFMKFVDHADYGLERLASEEAAERRRIARAAESPESLAAAPSANPAGGPAGVSKDVEPR